jgi:TP901 family phage tail tape measure protein
VVVSVANAITIRIDADAARAIAQINETALATGRLDAAGVKAGATFQSTGRKLTSVGQSLNRHVTLPIALAGGAAVKTAVDFNTSMTHIQALVGASSKQMEEYQKHILALAPAVGKGPKELADALYFVTSSGFKGAAALRVLDAGARAAASGLGDTQTVVDLVTSAVNTYGEKNLSAAKATDVLTAAVREGKAEPQDMAEAMGRIIPIAQAMGVSFGEVSGSVAALTLGGLDANEAVTSLRTTMSELLKPSAGAKTALQSVGVSVKDLQQRVADKGLQNALIFLNDKFHGNRQELGKVITQQRAFAGALQLIGPNADKAAKAIASVNAAAGDTDKAFSQASKSTQFQFNQALAQLQVTGVKVGADLIPILTQVAGTIGDVAHAFNGLSPTMQKVIVDGALVAAALGPIVRTAGAVSTTIGAVSKAFSLLSPTSTSAAGGLTSVSRAQRLAGASAVTAEAGTAGLAASLGPVAIAAGAAVGGIVALNYAFNALGSDADSLGAQLDDVKDSINGVADASRSADDASQRYKQTQLDVKSSALDVADAEKAYHKAVEASGKGSEDARRASLALAQARIRHQDAITANTDAEKANTAATRKAQAEQRRALNAVQDSTNAYRRQIGRLQQTKAAVYASSGASKEYSATLRKEADALRASAAKVQDYNPKLAALERQEARAADAAATLAANLGRLPTKKDIYVYTHFVSLGNVGGGSVRTGDHRAAGGPVVAGRSYTVNERGAETFIPSVSGTILTADRTRDNARHQTTHHTINNYYQVTIETRDLDAYKLKRQLDRITARRG